MRIYFVAGGKWYLKWPVLMDNTKNILISYHYAKNCVDELKSIDKNIFIDSGAFSAFNLNKEINLDNYCKFIKEVGGKVYAALDVIRNPQQSIDNYRYMKEVHGLNSIPVFHYNEHIKYLRMMLDEDVSYIGIGSTFQRLRNFNIWLDSVWSIILRYRPDIKVHGFGATNWNLIQRYPWYSVDSTTYLSPQRFGRVNHYVKTKKIFIQLSLRKFAVLKKLDYDKEFSKVKSMGVIHTIKSYERLVADITESNKVKNFSYLKNSKDFFM